MADGLGFAWWDSWIWGSGGVGNQSDLSFPQFIFGWLVGLDCMELNEMNRKIPTNPPSPSTCLVLPPTFPLASQGNQKKPVEYSSHSRNFPRCPVRSLKDKTDISLYGTTHVSAWLLPTYVPHLDCAAPLVSLVYYFSSLKSGSKTTTMFRNSLETIQAQDPGGHPSKFNKTNT